MSRFLRVVDGDRWDFADDLDAWKERKDLPGAAIGDLKPSASNKLSVWVIEDDGSNLNRVIAGYAANRAIIDSFDARLVDTGQVADLGIASEKAAGVSADKQAGKTWHWNLLELTYVKLGALAELLARGTPIERDAAEVRELILASVRAGHIKIEDLKPKQPPYQQSVWRIVTEALRAEGYTIPDLA